MAALMAALFAVVLIESGGRLGELAAMLAATYGRPVPVALGIMAVLAILFVVAAGFGAAIGPQLSIATGNLVLAMALLSAGFGAFIRPKPLAVDSARGGPLVSGMVGAVALGLGGASQFAVFALAARDPLPYAAAVGGTIGAAIVLGTMAATGERGRRAMSLRAVRYGTGGLLLAAGAIVGTTGLRLV